MSTTEFWWEFDAKMKAQRAVKTDTSLKGKFTEAEWDAARKKFREMENGGTADRTSR